MDSELNSELSELTLEMERQFNLKLRRDIEIEREKNASLLRINEEIKEKELINALDLQRANALIEGLRLEVAHLRDGINGEYFKNLEVRAESVEGALDTLKAKYATEKEKWGETRSLLKGVVETLSKEKESLSISLLYEKTRASVLEGRVLQAEEKTAELEDSLASAQTRIAQLSELKEGRTEQTHVIDSHPEDDAIRTRYQEMVHEISEVQSSSTPFICSSEEVPSAGGSPSSVSSTSNSDQWAPLPIEEIARRKAEEFRSRAAAFRLKAGILNKDSS